MFSHWLSTYCARFSSTPMISPPTMAPTMELRPPRITAGNTLMPNSDRAEETPLTMPKTTPASAETIAEIAHDSANIFCTEMPRLWATC